MKRLVSQKLRQEQTQCEFRLWYRLQNRQLAGVKFRRQHPIPPYVVDFCCLSKRLVIELDGPHHFEDAAILQDKQRQQFIETQGFTVLRFTCEEVERQLDAILEKILQHIQGKEGESG